MGKPSIYQQFMTGLKRHWRTALPDVKPLTEKRGHLSKASSFFAGMSPLAPYFVYLHFKTHSNIGGRFTINVILSKDEENPVIWADLGGTAVIGKFTKDANRIGRFLKNAARRQMVAAMPR